MPLALQRIFNKLYTKEVEQIKASLIKIRIDSEVQKY
jgi:phage terminase Nu1 subunit (DNA packaging protein)